MNTAMQIILARLAEEPLAERARHDNRLDNLAKLRNQLDETFRNEKELYFFRSLIDQIPDFLFVKDTSGRFVIANASISRAYGLPHEGLIGKTDHDLHPLERALEFSKREQEIVTSGIAQFDMEECFPNSEGITKWYSTTKVPLRDIEGTIVGLIGIARDVTERRRMEEQLSYMAHYDALTKLPNRTLFLNRLASALAERRLQPKRVSLLYIDLDGFKKVNDSWGHYFGDIFLQEASNRLRKVVTPGNFVARLGGDEFAVIQVLGSDRSRDDTLQFAEQIISHLSQPYEIGGHHVIAGATIGVAIAPEDDTDCEALLRDADLALYQAKGNKRGGIRFFEPEMNTRALERRLLEDDLRHALEAEQFEIYYQPLVDLTSSEVCGFEALLRWNHPERGLILPAGFIAAAEEIGLIVPIGAWVLRQACSQAASWPPGTKVAVNLSPLQFRDDGLFQTVFSALRSSGLSPERLELEITETVLLADSEANLKILSQLRNLGVQISLDDFGTGYSCLSYLRSFPFTKIKIDRSFVCDLEQSASCLAIVKAVSRLATDLGIKTIAEGIETQEQLDLLRSEGCNEGQGYLFSRPVQASRTGALIGLLSTS